jgi:hypothetical protein
MAAGASSEATAFGSVAGSSGGKTSSRPQASKLAQQRATALAVGDTRFIDTSSNDSTF